MNNGIMVGGLVVVLCAASACDNGADGAGGTGGSGASTGAGQAHASQPFVSGSRLKVRKIVAADGAEQQLGFRDTDLGFDCTFQLAEDGSRRCLPDAALAGQVWADASCTVPLVTATACAKPAFIRVFTDACAGNSAIWDVVDYSGPGFVGSPGSCTMGAPTSGYAGGTKRMLSSFAEGAEKVE